MRRCSSSFRRFSSRALRSSSSRCFRSYSLFSAPPAGATGARAADGADRDEEAGTGTTTAAGAWYGVGSTTPPSPLAGLATSLKKRIKND
jgi:hypothetical protein